MNVSLTPELESLVHEKVQSGLYMSASEVVREALRLLNDRDSIQQQRLAELKREVAVGTDQLERGEGITYDEQSLKAMFAGIKEQGRRQGAWCIIPPGEGMNYDGPTIQALFEDFLTRRKQEAPEQKEDAE